MSKPKNADFGSITCMNTENMHDRTAGDFISREIEIETLEGTMHANSGDYIITGIRGEKYPCKPDIFAETYEPIERDLIDRQAAIEAADRGCQEFRGIFGRIEDAINEIPPEQLWIPCSERLPEEDGEYLSYIADPDDKRCQYIMTAEFATARSSCSAKWLPDNAFASSNVVAWQPLPEPYRRDE